MNKKVFIDRPTSISGFSFYGQSIRMKYGVMSWIKKSNFITLLKYKNQELIHNLNKSYALKRVSNVQRLPSK